MRPETGAKPPADQFLAAVLTIGERLHLHTADVHPLRVHTSRTYLLPAEAVVVRLAEATDENIRRAMVALKVTRWLAAQGFPCVRPAHDDLLHANGMVANLWHNLAQPERRGPLPMVMLGSLLRELHQLPEPPFALPQVDPLARLRT